MKKYLLGLSIIVCMTVVMSAPVFVGAQNNGDIIGGDLDGDVPSSSGLSGKFENPLGINGVKDISGLIQLILEKIVIPIGAVVSVLFIIYAGFLYVSARGNPDAVSKAHQALLNAVIGTLIILGSLAISAAIDGTIKQIQQGL